MSWFKLEFWAVEASMDVGVLIGNAKLLDIVRDLLGLTGGQLGGCLWW